MSERDDPDIATDEGAPTEPEPTPLASPSEGVPAVSVSAIEIATAAEKLDAGTGPFAVDAERASGFRYSNRAYLIQIRRAGSGTVLIDPVNHGGSPLDVLRPLADVLATDEWILHAADQDLPCLAEVGLHPPALYDTELAGRLAGFDRVNLAAMVQQARTAKAHIDRLATRAPAFAIEQAALAGLFGDKPNVEAAAARMDLYAQESEGRWSGARVGTGYDFSRVKRGVTKEGADA
jgi:hypothetical protein